MAGAPLVRCSGVRSPAAKALNGTYEYQCVVGGRPCYRQAGVSSGNRLWFAGDTARGPAWVVAPGSTAIGEGAPDEIIAISPSPARWPWEAGAWEVCGRSQCFTSSPAMCFTPVMPAAELTVSTGVGPGWRLRCAGEVNGRHAYQDSGASGLRLFFMPKMSRWLLAEVAEGGGGIRTLVARSLPDDGSSWASLWPWEVEAHGWEAPAGTAHRLVADGEWAVLQDMQVRLASPAVTVSTTDGTPEAAVLQGLYEQRGMTNGRAYYVQCVECTDLAGGASSMCLWFAEDRGQWVITPPERLGNSRAVLARIASRTWWPWEAHLGGTTSPHMLGAAPLATLRPWDGGQAVLAASRAGWEVADAGGALRPAAGMAVELCAATQVAVEAMEDARYPFLGDYERAGLLSARPFFLQAAPAPLGPRFALWYAEGGAQWLITEDYRLLDDFSVDARSPDSAWFPYEVAAPWEVADGQGGLARDPRLRVRALP